MNIDDLKLIAGVVSGLLALGSAGFYIRDIIRRTTKPERAAWTIWVVLNYIFLAINLSGGDGFTLASIYLVAISIAATTTLVLSFKYGDKQIYSRRDKYSLVAAGIGLILWALTSNPLFSLFITIAIDALGVWLTVLKTIKFPHSETLIFWVAGMVTTPLSIFASPEFTFELIAFQVYVFIVSGIMSGIIIWGKRA